MLKLEPGDLVVYSSKQIPGNELAIGRVQNQLATRGIEVITEKQAHVHVSGHPGRPELEATGMDLAICTGRPPEELALAFEVLGFELPAVCDSEPRFRKPRPDGLLALAARFGARRVLFAGDTRDDAAALRAAREQRPELAWTFAAIGPDRARIAQAGDLRASTLRELLAGLREG